MKAIRIHATGGPEVLKYEEAPVPQPGPGEALIKLAAIGVNFIDVYYRKGQYPSPLPFIPGHEGAGVVAALGPGVKGLKVGARVAWAGGNGSYAEFQSVPAARLVTLPAKTSFKDAAAAMLQGMTAHYLSHSTYPVKKGDWCLVHAAAGGVGLLLTQMIRRRGGRVLGTVSTAEKAALAAAAGADEVVLYTKDDFVAAAKRVTKGKGMAVVYDSVGKDTFEKSLDCLAPRGTMALYGQSSGPLPPVDLQVLNKKGSLFVTRPTLGHYTATPRELSERAGAVLGAIAKGRLELRIGAEFPLKDAAEAHRALEGRKTAGKVLLVP